MDGYRIRVRMEMELRHQADMMRGELENYNECFSPKQRRDIHGLIVRMRNLADNLACYQTVTKG